MIEKENLGKNMVRLITKTSEKAGLPPGVLIHVGEERMEKVRMMLFDYDQPHYEEKEIASIEEILAYKDKQSVTWVNIDGLHEVRILEEVGRHFNIHPLVLEDILNTAQRPKLESYDEYDFIVVKMLTYDDDNSTFQKEHVSIILGPTVVFSFQEKKGDVFEIIRQRIRNDDSRLRKSGPDYLVYRILDSIVDHYFVVLERYGERIEDLEEELTEKPEAGTLQRLHKLKRELVLLRKLIWPLREVINGLQKRESALIKESTQLFLRDVYDHMIHVIDTLENFREMSSSLLDLYLSSISNKMNEVMKILTIMASIFIPLTFIAGIYGMNFKFMPELEWRWGYAAVWVVMVGLGIGLVLFFKKKRWF